MICFRFDKEESAQTPPASKARTFGDLVLMCCCDIDMVNVGSLWWLNPIYTLNIW